MVYCQEDYVPNKCQCLTSCVCCHCLLASQLSNLGCQDRYFVSSNCSNIFLHSIVYRIPSLIQEDQEMQMRIIRDPVWEDNHAWLTCASSSVSTLKESYESRKSIVSEWLLKDNKHFSRELIDILYIWAHSPASMMTRELKESINREW